jgi:hypothetical protein
VHDHDCTCGYEAAIGRLVAIGVPPLANTPLMRIVALGHAALALGRANAAWQAAVSSRAMTHAAGLAYLAAHEAAGRVYREALQAALGEEGSK